jgi:hypothetical protein
MTEPTPEHTIFTPFKSCKHRTLQIMSTNALGCTVGCVYCDETFHLDASVVDEKFYHFTHNSPRGVEHDMELLIHYKVIEK